jgi:two-component sensor histidine kinase
MGGETKTGNAAHTRLSGSAHPRPEQGGGIFVELLFNQTVAFPKLARSLLEAVHEPLLAIDRSLKILFANTSFHRTFQADQGSIEGRNLFSLNDGAWKSPGLLALLDSAHDDHSAAEGFEISHDFSWIGARTYLLHAGKLIQESRDTGIIFLSFNDVTAQRALEKGVIRLRERGDQLLRQKDILLVEIQHRVVNSLQIIASILMLKARSVASDETRRHLHDAHRRVLSIATIQQHLHCSGHDDMIEVEPYLSKLCICLAESMTDDAHQAVLKVDANGGAMTSSDVVSLGLIVTELVINALKYALPPPGELIAISVCYERNDTAWRLSVTDNGAGAGSSTGGEKPVKSGLGTSLVKALADELDAQVVSESRLGGMCVSVTHPTFVSRFQDANGAQLILPS